MSKNDIKVDSNKNEEVVTLTADVPEDEYYREQIKTLQHKLDDAQTKYEMALGYIETLEKDKLELSNRNEKLEKAVVKLSIGE